jgi:hypothetical protein
MVEPHLDQGQKTESDICLHKLNNSSWWNECQTTVSLAHSRGF